MRGGQSRRGSQRGWFSGVLVALAKGSAPKGSAGYEGFSLALKFFFEENIQLEPTGIGAPYALALSARSAVFQEFDGGPGRKSPATAS